MTWVFMVAGRRKRTRADGAEGTAFGGAVAGPVVFKDGVPADVDVGVEPPAVEKTAGGESGDAGRLRVGLVESYFSLAAVRVHDVEEETVDAVVGGLVIWSSNSREAAQARGMLAADVKIGNRNGLILDVMARTS